MKKYSFSKANQNLKKNTKCTKKNTKCTKKNEKIQSLYYKVCITNWRKIP